MAQAQQTLTEIQRQLLWWFQLANVILKISHNAIAQNIPDIVLRSMTKLHNLENV